MESWAVGVVEGGVSAEGVSWWCCRSVRLVVAAHACGRGHVTACNKVCPGSGGWGPRLSIAFAFGVLRGFDLVVRGRRFFFGLFFHDENGLCLLICLFVCRVGGFGGAVSLLRWW